MWSVHAQVVHCDLKAKNILLNKERTMAKIGDVGLARIMAETHLSTASGFFGTFAYTAPEVLGRRRCDEKVLRVPFALLRMMIRAFPCTPVVFWQPLSVQASTVVLITRLIRKPIPCTRDYLGRNSLCCRCSL